MSETIIFRVSAIPTPPAQRASDRLVDVFVELWNAQSVEATARNYLNADLDGRTRLIADRLRNYPPVWRELLADLLVDFATAVNNGTINEFTDGGNYADAFPCL